MKTKQFELVPTTYEDKDKEEWKYTTLYTDIWNFEILMTLDDLIAELKRCKEAWEMFKYRKLDEFSKVIEHYGELNLDLENVKILWYKEHHLIVDLKKQRELEKEQKAKPKTLTE